VKYNRNTIIAILIILIGVNSTLVAQNSQKIIGKIVNANTGFVIELATVYSSSTSQGTVSNNEGIFEYNSNLAHATDSLVISCIGYESIKLSLNTFLNSKDNVFRLVPVVYMLDPVVIKPFPKAEEIIEKAKKNLDKNYCQHPFLADCYFTEFIKEDGKYVRAMELALQQYNKGSFPNPMFPIPMQQIKIIEKRKSANNTVLKNSPLNRCFSLNYLLITSNLRNYFISKNYSYTFDSITKLNNQTVYVITGLSETEKVTYYISENDYKVVQLTFFWNPVLPKYRMGDNYFTISQTSGKLIFKEIGTILYPFYTSNILEIYYFKNKSDTSIWHKQNVASELLYSNIITENAKEIDKNERVQILAYPNIYNLDIPYNEDYWQRNNYIFESMDKKQIFNSINGQNN